jgi:hypothetical protein
MRTTAAAVEGGVGASVVARLSALAVFAELRPEVGFVRRDDMRRNYAQLRFSQRPTSIRAGNINRERAVRVYDEDRDTLSPSFPDLQNRALIVKINRLFRF